MNHRVMVFAPSPQLTVTIESLGGIADLHLHPGGQGIWQARTIASLGVPVVLCAGLGGETGAVLRQLIEQEDVGRSGRRRIWCSPGSTGAPTPAGP